VRARTRLFAVLVVALIVSSAGCQAAAAPAWIYPADVSAGIPVAPAVPAADLPAPVPAPGAVAPGDQPDVAPSAAPGAALPLAAPGGTAGDGVTRTRAAVNVPILYYHRIIAPPRGFRQWSRAQRERFLAYDVVPAAFEAQLDWLVAHGYTTILPRDLAAYWDNGAALPERPVMITFDDGTHDWASTVLPLLQERGMVAQFYVTLQSLPRGGMTWRELRELAAAGMGIGAHGLHHRQLAGLGGRHPAVSEAVMRREVTKPRRIIEARLGIVPDSIAYVGGGFDATLRRIVREAGYTTARSILHGSTQLESRRYTLRVVRVGSRTDVVDVVKGTLVPGLPRFTRLVQRGG
jgi:peptidoglycan/xylan/chitin deacetylase (PgdA/CDA1 family)